MQERPTSGVVLAVEWATSDTRWFTLFSALVVVSVLLVSWRSSWHVRRLVATAGLLVVAITFAALAKSDRGEQHFTRGASDPLEVSNPTFSVVAAGDFGTGNDQERQVSLAIKEWVGDHGADAFLSVGDTVYPEGDPRYFERSWHEPFGWVADRGLDVLGTLGNHDYAADDQGRAVMKLLGMPGPWYRTTIGDADIIVLDANRLNEESQTRWLRTQLRSARHDWTIVIMHQPPYSCSRGGDPQVREHWAPLLEEYEVDLVISGHEHNYQRFLSDEQTTYVVTGGGGDRLYPVGDCDASFPPLVVSDDESHHFFVFEGSATRLEGAAIGMDGSVLDQFTIRKGRDR
jgi:hypothetical protein